MTQTLYLSHLTLNPRSRVAWRDAASLYEMHCTLRTRLFATAPQEAERFLFRLERDHETGLSTVLLQSRTAPDFSALQSGYCLRPPEVRPDYGEKLQAIARDQVMRFRLLANPTVKRKNSQDKPARFSLFKEQEQRGWLARKFATAGAEPIEFRINKFDLQYSHKHADEEGRQTHFAVLFEGILRVTDPVALRAAVENGIGSAKGYGFGLLSLAPA